MWLHHWVGCCSHSQIWEDIFLHFITSLPKSRGYDAVLVVVDRLSKYGHFILLKPPYTARKIAETFSQVIHLHGMPLFILSDRDPLLSATFGRNYFRCRASNCKWVLLTIQGLMGKRRWWVRAWGLTYAAFLQSNLKLIPFAMLGKTLVHYDLSWIYKSYSFWSNLWLQASNRG